MVLLTINNYRTYSLIGPGIPNNSRANWHSFKLPVLILIILWPQFKQISPYLEHWLLNNNIHSDAPKMSLMPQTDFWIITSTCSSEPAKWWWWRLSFPPRQTWTQWNVRLVMDRIYHFHCRNSLIEKCYQFSDYHCTSHVPIWYIALIWNPSHS